MEETNERLSSRAGCSFVAGHQRGAGLSYRGESRNLQRGLLQSLPKYEAAFVQDKVLCVLWLRSLWEGCGINGDARGSLVLGNSRVPASQPAWRDHAEQLGYSMDPSKTTP